MLRFSIFLESSLPKFFPKKFCKKIPRLQLAIAIGEKSLKTF